MVAPILLLELLKLVLWLAFVWRQALTLRIVPDAFYLSDHTRRDHGKARCDLPFSDDCFHVHSQSEYLMEKLSLLPCMVYLKGSFIC
jgi:hypothetical protein